MYCFQFISEKEYSLDLYSFLHILPVDLVGTLLVIQPWHTNDDNKSENKVGV